MSKKIVTLVAYAIHGHENPGKNEEKTFDYVDYFSRISSNYASYGAVEVKERKVAISEIQELPDGDFAIRFVSGDPDSIVLSLDLGTLTTRERDPGEGSIFVNERWVIISPANRIVGMETSRPTVPIEDITKYLENAYRLEYARERVSVALVQIPSPKFMEDVYRMDRIREVSVTYTRPNSPWGDAANARVEKMMKAIVETNPGDVQMVARASEGQTLPKDKGVVKELDVITKADHPFVKSASVKGLFPGGIKEQPLHLNNSKVTEIGQYDTTLGSDAKKVTIFSGFRNLRDRVIANRKKSDR
jgi:hypothetical protein